MNLFNNTALFGLALSVGQITSCFAADKPKLQTLTPEKASQQVAELDGKRVIVKLKNGNSTSGWARWKSGEKFVVEHADGVWKCGEQEAISFAEVFSVQPRNRFLGAVKDTGKVAWFVVSLPVQMVAAATGYPPCGW